MSADAIISGSLNLIGSNPKYKVNGVEIATGGGGSPTGAAGGDLGGNYPNPSVERVKGVAVSGTPASGRVLKCTSSTTASWQDEGKAIDYTANIKTAVNNSWVDLFEIHLSNGDTAAGNIILSARGGNSDNTNLAVQSDNVIFTALRRKSDGSFEFDSYGMNPVQVVSDGSLTVFYELYLSGSSLRFRAKAESSLPNMTWTFRYRVFALTPVSISHIS
jgi:hypothetical protein